MTSDKSSAPDAASKEEYPERDKEEPQIGGDPQSTGQEGEKSKRVVAPDPDKVKEAEEKKNNT